MKRLYIISIVLLFTSIILCNQAIALSIVSNANRYIAGRAESGVSGGTNELNTFAYIGTPSGSFSASGAVQSQASGVKPGQICPVPGICFPWNETVTTSSLAEATQESNIINTGQGLVATATGNAHLYAQNDYSNPIVDNLFELGFQIDEAAPFTLKSQSVAGRNLILFNYNTNVYLVNEWNSLLDIDMSGMLDPGTWYMGVYAGANYYYDVWPLHSYYGDFTLDFTVGTLPVPEPTTLIFLLGGLAGLAIVRRTHA
jgi:hypothetical protein